jgi:UrcA family protein
MNRFSIAAVTLAAALALVPAQAGTASVVVSASAPNSFGAYQVAASTVTFDDLDVSTSQGAAKLLVRIDAASRAVCGEQQGRTMDERRARIFDTCRARATRYAIKKVDAPQLTQIAVSH